MQKVLEILGNQEHLCAKVMGLFIVLILFFVEYRGEWSALPKEARTNDCERMRNHIDSVSLDRYAHARHFSYDMIQCLVSIDNEITRPLVNEVLLPTLTKRGVVIGSHPAFPDDLNLPDSAL